MNREAVIEFIESLPLDAWVTTKDNPEVISLIKEFIDADYFEDCEIELGVGGRRFRKRSRWRNTYEKERYLNRVSCSIKKHIM